MQDQQAIISQLQIAHTKCSIPDSPNYQSEFSKIREEQAAFLAEQEHITEETIAQSQKLAD